MTEEFWITLRAKYLPFMRQKEMAAHTASDYSIAAKWWNILDDIDDQILVSRAFAASGTA